MSKQKEEIKKEYIELLNRNFRTILSYGNDGLVPMGEFIITDIESDQISDFFNLNTTRIIFTKVDNKNVSITLPIKAFFDEYNKLAEINSDKLSIGSDLAVTVEGVQRKAEIKVLSDSTLKDLVKAETMPLDECDADYTIKGEQQAVGSYSICPINIGKYRERIRAAEKDVKREGRVGRGDIEQENYR